MFLPDKTHPACATGKLIYNGGIIMKNSLRRSIAAVMAALTIAGCGTLSASAETPAYTSETTQEISLRFDGSPIVMNLGSSFTLPTYTSYFFAGLSITVTGVSNNCVTVENGVVKAVNAGTCTINITLPSGKTISPTIIVAMPEVTLDFSKQDITMGKGEITKLTKLLSEYVGEINWSSSNTKVVKVNEKGQIVAKRTGTAVITAEVGAGQKASITVNVKKAPKTLTLSKENITMKVGQYSSLDCTVNAGAAAYNLKYTSSDPKVVTVDANSGKLTAHKAGKAVITAKTPNGKTASCTVYVKDLPTEITLNRTNVTLKKGGATVLNATLPDGTNAGEVRFIPSNDKVVSVESNGLVKAIKTGVSYIKVKTAQGAVAYCRVTVV